jgi:hypothetical protein
MQPSDIKDVLPPSNRPAVGPRSLPPININKRNATQMKQRKLEIEQQGKQFRSELVSLIMYETLHLILIQDLLL